MEDRFIHGTPPMALLPPRNFVFKISEDNYVIEIPRKGSYHDLAPEVFDEESGEFNIYDEESKTFYTPAITKVLFATSQYPDLKFNQFFVPYVLKLEEDKVIIVGQVVDMMVKVDEPEEGKGV